MRQSRCVALSESLLNTAIGFVVAFIGWPIIADLSGVTFSHGQHWAHCEFFHPTQCVARLLHSTVF